MNYQVVIYSSDAVFARMLELEFLARDRSVLVTEQPNDELYSDVALLDLDSASAPSPDCYGRMIGFTRGVVLADDGTRRRCSMILHRPFEMRLLRREVLGDAEMLSRTPAEPMNRALKITLDQRQSVLQLEGQRVRLTPKELSVMQCLLSHRGFPVSRETLSACIGESSANKTDVYVCYLRQKLNAVFPQKVIYTVRKKGYLIP